MEASPLAAAITAFFTARADELLVILYGSQLTGRARPDSDVDVAVLSRTLLTVEQRLELTQELAQTLGREVDLIDLRTAHGPLLQEVVGRGQVLVRRDPEAYAQLLKRMWYEREDDGRFFEKTVNERMRQWQK